MSPALTATLDPARIVFEGQQFAIYDIHDLLPHHSRYPYGSSANNPNTGDLEVGGHYSIIPGRYVEAIIVHQTAGGYQDAIKQVQNTNAFFIRDPKWKQDSKGKWVWTAEGRGWPAFAYTWFVPYAPLIWQARDDGRDLWVVWQTQHLDIVSWHTGDRMNTKGGGLAFQGYFLEPSAGITHPMKGTDGHPSDAQLAILPSFWVEYAVPVLGSKILTGHWRHGKLSCPGQDLREGVLALGGGDD